MRLLSMPGVSSLRTCAATLLATGIEAAEPTASAQWPAAVREIQYPSAADQTLQPAFFYAPPGRELRPLLVALHTWSSDYRKTTGAPYVAGCIARGWAFIHPDFRGPNHRPEAAGSELALQDVLSAVAFARRTASIDTSRIYLVGNSGGGHLALLLAGRAPDIWAGISAWVPITDLRAWYRECRARKLGYADDIVRLAGGDPETDPAAARECTQRSPLTHLAAARGLPIDLNAGILDGHTGSVPISHTLLAYNALAAEHDRLSPEQIRHFVAQARVPPELDGASADAAYGHKPVLFRRQSGPVRLTVFDGGHEIVHEAAFAWLARQQRWNRTAP
jgi:acetyl esterase/lipase